MHVSTCSVAAKAIGPYGACGATAISNASAIAAIFLVSKIPPTKATSGCKISIAPCLIKFLNAQRVYRRSPVASGVETLKEISLNASSFSGNTTSS